MDAELRDHLVRLGQQNAEIIRLLTALLDLHRLSAPSPTAIGRAGGRRAE